MAFPVGFIKILGFQMKFQEFFIRLQVFSDSMPEMFKVSINPSI